MPRVAFIDLSVDGNERRFEAWFNAKKGFYIKDLPESIRSAGVRTVDKKQGDREYQTTDGDWKACTTLDDLKAQLRAAVDAYHENAKATTKVILYQLQLSRRVAFVKDPKAKHHRNQWKMKPWAKANGLTYTGDYSEGFGFELRWTKRFRIQKDGVEYHAVDVDENDGTESVGYHDGSFNNWGEMEWTAEREAFFANADLQIGKLAELVAGFIGKDTTELATLIDAGSTKLLGQ